MSNIKNLKNFNNKVIFTYIKNNNIQSIKNYIDSGYDLNLNVNDYGYTPLICVSISNQIKIAKLLLNAGVDVNKQDNDGDTALIWATKYNNHELVKLLLNSDADIDKQNNVGNTALIFAVIYDRIDIVKHLLNSGADIDKQNNGGNTALILAAYYNNCETVELLLDYGADEFILDYDNKSFYDCLNTENQQYFLHKYPTSVYNAIYHNYKKSFTEFVKDYNIKNN